MKKETVPSKVIMYFSYRKYFQILFEESVRYDTSTVEIRNLSCRKSAGSFEKDYFDGK